MPDLKEIVENVGYVSQAQTLGLLLAEFGKKFECEIIPHDAPEYFRYYANKFSADYILTDIHITRRNVEICPKQDLNFALEADDIVEAGMLIC
jgi:hypothetical protein